MKSIRSVYKIGHGPSSSHTVGPYRAAKFMGQRYPEADAWKVTLYGSLAFTGEGHGTGKAIRAALPEAEIIFNREEKELPHPNTMIFTAMKDGKVIAEFPPEKVMERRIAKPQTIKTMQTILEHVVSQGLGRKAGSRMFKVAGKTGTAQIAEGGGYKTGIVKYWLSFAGYFPADNPRYTCIVCLKKSGLPASGGGMSGVVFHHISEGVMARNLKLDVKDAHDSSSVGIPDVKSGNILDANYVLRYLDIKTNQSWSGSYANGNPIWGKAERQSDLIALQQVQIDKNTVPDVTGMGARDAVYLLESLGLKVKLHGRGKVRSQSYSAGKQITAGSECVLNLE